MHSVPRDQAEGSSIFFWLLLCWVLRSWSSTSGPQSSGSSPTPPWTGGRILFHSQGQSGKSWPPEENHQIFPTSVPSLIISGRQNAQLLQLYKIPSSPKASQILHACSERGSAPCLSSHSSTWPSQATDPHLLIPATHPRQGAKVKDGESRYWEGSTKYQGWIREDSSPGYTQHPHRRKPTLLSQTGKPTIRPPYPCSTQ